MRYCVPRCVSRARRSASEMAPIDVGEIGGTNIAVNTLWLRGGFPDSVTASSDRTSLAWRRDFLRSYLERDVPMFAPRLPTAAIERLWEMLAHGQGSLLNQARLASSLGVSSPAVGRYIDLLLVRRLRPWAGNLGKRLVRSPKVYVRDAAYCTRFSKSRAVTRCSVTQSPDQVGKVL